MKGEQETRGVRGADTTLRKPICVPGGAGERNETNQETKVGNMKEAYDHQLLLKHLPLEFKQFLEHLQNIL